MKKIDLKYFIKSQSYDLEQLSEFLLLVESKTPLLEKFNLKIELTKIS